MQSFKYDDNSDTTVCVDGLMTTGAAVVSNIAVFTFARSPSACGFAQA